MDNMYYSTYKKRNGNSKSSLIDVGKVRHFITKSIDKDGNSISYDNSCLELLNKNLYICIAIQWITGSFTTTPSYEHETRQ